MKFFVLLIAAAVIAGVVYHEEITDYVADVSNGSYGASGPSLVGTVQSVGSKSSAAFGSVGKAFGR